MRATALKIIQTVAAEVGLPIPASITSTDAGVVQLVALLNSAGYESCIYYPWEFLQEKQVILTDGVNVSYPMPANYLYQIDNTGNTLESPNDLFGPITPQVWSYNETTLIGGITTMFQIRDNKMQFYPLPPAGVTYQWYYIRHTWVIDAVGAPKSEITKNDDVPAFDWMLMIKYVKMKYLNAKGLNSTTATAEFNNLWNSLIGKDTGAPVLNAAMVAYANYGNLPEGNWPS
jgi:hypothetical protein